MQTRFSQISKCDFMKNVFHFLSIFFSLLKKTRSNSPFREKGFPLLKINFFVIPNSFSFLFINLVSTAFGTSVLDNWKAFVLSFACVRKRERESVCVRERERERERERKRVKTLVRKKVCVCVREREKVCVGVREREKEGENSGAQCGKLLTICPSVSATSLSLSLLHGKADTFSDLILTLRKHHKTPKLITLKKIFFIGNFSLVDKFCSLKSRSQSYKINLGNIQSLMVHWFISTILHEFVIVIWAKRYTIVFNSMYLSMYLKTVGGHSNNTWKNMEKCHRKTQGWGRVLAKVSSDIFSSKILSYIDAFWPAFWKEKGYSLEMFN